MGVFSSLVVQFGRERPTRPSGLGLDEVIERFKSVKQQIPLLYAVIAVNIAGLHLTGAGLTIWSAIIAPPVIGMMLWRLFHWNRLSADTLSRQQMEHELRRNLTFTKVLSLAFLCWVIFTLSGEAAANREHVVLFASLAAIGCAIALSAAPEAARQPLFLLGLPISAWAALSGEVDLTVLGFSLAIVIILIGRILVIQERGFRALLVSRAETERALETLKTSEERYRLVGRATNDLVWDLDLTSGKVLWNAALHTQFGYSDDELQTTIDWWAERIHPEHRAEVVGKFDRLLHEGHDTFESEYPFRKADGSYAHVYDRGYVVHNAHGAAARIVGAMQDLTTRKLAEEKLLYAATCDALTGLPNRKLFCQKLHETVDRAVNEHRWSSVLLLDVDEFKQVNDVLGHDAGDALLKELAIRLNDSCTHDEVARLGGDEFAIILDGVASAQEVEDRANGILARLREPFSHNGRLLDCSAAIGAALIPHHGKTAEEILKNADLALYASKAERCGGFTLFHSGLRAESRRRTAMTSLAKAAVSEGGIVPYYQPKISFEDGTVGGFEALLRWRQAGRGIQLPSRISAAFDNVELSEAISETMVEQVLCDIRTWLDRDLPFGHIAINAAAAEFRRDGFAERLLARVNAADIPLDCLQLEVTETVFMGRGTQNVSRALETLGAAGLTIALDDFGTGYASLQHLKQFPVDVIKIDRRFVRDMVTDPEDAAIVRAVTNLGRSLGLQVVAEGVETQAQADHLARLGCDFGQGFLYSKAVPADDVSALISALPKPALNMWPTQSGKQVYARHGSS